MTRERRIGIFYILLAVSGYSFFPVFTKSMLAEGMQPVDIGVFRFLIAASVLWIIRLSVAARAGELKLPRLPLVWVGVMGLCMALAALSGFFGMTKLPSATYLVLFYSYPMMTALIEVALGKRFPVTGWIALALTLIGVLVAAPDFSAGLTGDNAIGVATAFFNGLAVAVYFVISSRVLKDTRDRLGSTAIILTAVLAVISITALALGFNPPPTPRAWGLVVGLAVIGTVIPVFALNQGLPRLGGAEAGVVASIEPITSSLLAMLFLGEIMTGSHWIGGLVIVSGIIVLQAPALLKRTPQPVDPVIESP